MRHYRLYMIEAGHIAGPPEILQCQDDQDAIEQARHLFKECVIEVWETTRFIARIEASDRDGRRAVIGG
jgi:hypothetical protein